MSGKRAPGLRIGWLQDLDPMALHGGGGEKSDRAVILEGIRRGHDIEVLVPGTPAWGPWDLLIVSNASVYSRDHLLKQSQSQPYVCYIHDYWPMCFWRLHYPGTPCGGHSHRQFAERLVLGSALNVFLSPLHLDAWAKVIPEVKGHPHILHVSPVDTEHFVDPKVPRIPGSVLGANALLPFKGRDATLEYVAEHPELYFTFIGGADLDVPLPPNATYRGAVTEAQLPQMYGQSEHFILLPQSPQPCERTAIEARLCGVPKFIVNDLIGALTFKEWGFPDRAFRDWVRAAPKRWWEAVEKVV